jgi:ADP-ribosylglycohydrolase
MPTERRRQKVSKDILDKVYGCLIGGAIGDALGAPVEGWYYSEIREKYGKVRDFMPFKKEYCGGPPGSITDDTVLRHYMCLAIVRKGGRITPDDFAEVWLNELNPERLWTNEKIVKMKLEIGMNPWETGKGQPPVGCASMAIAPVGIINAGDPAQAYQDGFNIASINQEGVNRDAAASLAAGIASAFLPGATVQTVLDTMTRYSSDIFRRGIILTMDIAHKSKTVDEFVEKFYEKMLDWTWPQRNWNKEKFFSGNSLEFIPAAMGILHLCGEDPNESIVEGASFGRDCDTIASIIGQIVGALYGASALRKDWIEDCEKANEDFFEELEGDRKANFYSMAQRLVEALKKEKSRLEERARTLEKILSGQD